MQFWFRYLIGVFTLVVVWGCGAKADRSIGDGVLRDRGFWSYPRYQVVFEPFSPTNNLLTTFEFKGVPSVAMTMILTEGHNGSGRSLACIHQDPAWKDVVIGVKLTQADGTLVAEAHAPLKNWELAQSAANARLWHVALRDVRLRRGTAYRSTIIASGLRDELRLPALRLLIEGGGNELP